jgi:hypothetical protein
VNLKKDTTYPINIFKYKIKKINHFIKASQELETDTKKCLFSKTFHAEVQVFLFVLSRSPFAHDFLSNRYAIETKNEQIVFTNNHFLQLTSI